MRAGIGLIGLLLSVAIIFYVMFGGPGNSSYVRTELETKQNSEQFANQISGKDKEGNLASDSITLEASNKGVLVTSVVPGGAFDQHFGLQTGDIILEIGPLLTKEQAADDASAKAYLHDAYARNETLVVQRGTQKLKLPDERQTATPMISSGGAPANPRPTNATGATRDLIDKIQSH